MTRTQLVPLRGAVVTPDVVERVRLLELRLHAQWQGRAQLHFSGVSEHLAHGAEVPANPGPTGIVAPEFSMRPTGREVYLRLQPVDGSTGAPWVQALWAVAVPLGFVPWNRHPVDGVGDAVFHVPGVWSGLMESHWAFGYGEKAWSSLCCAAQLDVGRWEGDRFHERLLQANLHRAGYSCGPVDGVVGEHTLAALRQTPLAGLPVAQAALAAVALPDVAPGASSAQGRRTGVLDVPGEDLVTTGYGGVRVARTPRGYAIEVDGPGRVVADFGGYSLRR